MSGRVRQILCNLAVGLSLSLLAAGPGVAVSTETVNLSASPARMAEWNDWRFGLFIHWGPWSQSANGSIWRIVQSFPPDQRARQFDYWKTFNPEKFDPTAWAKAAKAAGMRYVVFVVKHHDGFNLYDTALSDYKITAPGSPYAGNPKADITRAVVDAFRAEGLAVGFYFSHIDWHHPDGRYFSRAHWDYDLSRIESDPASWRRFADYEKGQLHELLTNYGKIDILWFDIYWPTGGYAHTPITNPAVKADMLDVLHMIKRLQPDLIYDDRGTDVYGDFESPEQFVPDKGLPGNWESSITITNGQGYWYKGEQASAKSTKELVRTLIEIASKGGNFLMNVGPRPDGQFMAAEYEALAGIGTWMRSYQDSIYGTRRSLFHNLPWGRSTTRGNTLYLHVFDWPADGHLMVPGLHNTIKRAWRLSDSSEKPLAVTAQGHDPIIAVGTMPDNEVATVIAVEVEGTPQVTNAVRQIGKGALVLPAGEGELGSGKARYNYGHGIRRGDFIENMRSATDAVRFDFNVNQSGRYSVILRYALQKESHNGTYVLKLDDSMQVLRGKAQATAQWTGRLVDQSVVGKDGASHPDNSWAFKDQKIGILTIDTAGEHSLTLIPDNVQGEELFFLKSVTLEPVQ